MRSAPPTLGALLAGSVLVLTGCALPDADGNAESAPGAVDLAFAYTADGGDGFIDQTLAITNNGAAAGAPDLDIVPLDAQGEEVPGVEVVTAFGSDEGQQVVPAFTEVIDVLKFKGKGADDVVDVAVTVADPGTLRDDVPPANDLRVRRFDVGGDPDNENTLGAVALTNTYDAPITVMVVGLEFADAAPGELQHFRRTTALAGPLTIQPGEKVRERVADQYRARFYGSVRAYLVR